MISNEESDANFDASISPATADIYRNIFKNVDMDSSKLMEPLRVKTNSNYGGFPRNASFHI